jgi:hypothetical protein
MLLWNWPDEPKHAAKALQEFAAKQTLDDLLKLSTELNLKNTIKWIPVVQETLQAHARAKARSTAELRGALERLNQLSFRIVEDLAEITFLPLTAQERDLFIVLREPWGSVPEAFPSAVDDIREASKCLALGRSTASVFHSMRVLDRALRALAGKLRVSRFVIGYHTWGRIIDGIDSKISKLASTKTKTISGRANVTKTKAFYAKAASQLEYFQYAWRDYTMHAEKRYSAGEAKDILAAVQAFMKFLAAGGVKEKAKTL